MKNKKQSYGLFLALSVSLILFPNGFTLGAPENLDEIFLRKERLSQVTWGPSLLEDISNNYTWQPETLQYRDVITGNEVWRFSNTPNTLGGATQDISITHWSADGNRVLFHSKRNNQAYPLRGYVNHGGISYISIAGGGATLENQPPNPTYWKVIAYDPSYPEWKLGNYYESPSTAWMLSNTDGSRLKPAYGASAQTAHSDSYVLWSPVLSDVLYQGSYVNPVNALYKVTVSDSIIANSLFIDLPASVTRTGLKKGISGDGTKVLINDVYNGRWYVATVFPETSKKLETPTGYDKQLNFDYYWGIAPSSWAGYHDQFLSGAQNGIDGIWNYIMPENAEGSWWRARLLGSGTDGAPVHISDQTPPYEWGEEVEPVNGVGVGKRDPWCPQGIVPDTECVEYVSHFTPDRWGHLGISTKSGNFPYGTSIYDMRNHKYGIFGGEKAFTGVNWVQHHDWEAWSDWSASSGAGVLPNDYLQDKVMTQNYTDVNSQRILAHTHTRYNDGGLTGPYQSLTRPVQSPDGTKVMFNSTFLNQTNNEVQLFWTVAYYPYPPEIKLASKINEKIRLSWDFNQGEIGNPNHINPRTYAKRGWPHEINDRPPSPREIKEFRIWKSTDKENWTPLGKTSYSNCKGENECGTWTEESWNFDLIQANNTTAYYALTSIENSGLESGSLSNIWKVTIDDAGNIISQTEERAYPANPGNKSNFYTASPDFPESVSFTHKKSPAIVDGQYTLAWQAPTNKELIRYYNVYAEDGDLPEVVQQNKIASVPATSDYEDDGLFSFIDWAGNPDGSTQYRVTSVDYQGNESGIVTPLDTTPPNVPTGLNIL